jgi:hypothetical protein
MSLICEICGANFKKRGREKFNLHMTLYNDNDMQERKLNKEIKDVNPNATMLHYQANLKRMQKSPQEMQQSAQEMEAVRKYLRIVDAEDLLNEELDDDKGVVADAAASAIPFGQHEIYDEDIDELRALVEQGRRLKDTDVASLGGKKSRSKNQGLKNQGLKNQGLKNNHFSNSSKTRISPTSLDKMLLKHILFSSDGDSLNSAP